MRAKHFKRVKGSVKKGVLSILYEYVEAFLLAMILLVVLFTFCFRVAGVVGTSMEPTLSNGDRLILKAHFYEPSYGDIVVVNRYTDEPLIKRVIAVEGDTLRIDAETGAVYRDGVMLNETYIKGVTLLKDMTGEVTVPQGYVFLMGDNRSVSKDSRNEEIGMIRVEDIIGCAVLRVWPFSSFGILM